MSAEQATVSEALTWAGFKLDALDDNSVARIEGVFVDAGDGSPAWLVVRRGRFGRRSAVPHEFVAAGVGRAWIPCSRETVRDAPEVDPAAGLTAAEERKLADHFGLGQDSRRRTAIVEAEDDARTAVPATA